MPQTTRSPSTSADAVVRYYDATWIDYRLVWFNRVNLAMHFGYHDPGTANHHEALQNGNRVCADIAGIRPGDRVLDAGCGLGGGSYWLAEQRGAEVVGITIVPGQVQSARSEAAARGLAGRVTFELADYLATPFPPASFDVAWAMESLCHAADKARFYREMARVLRPGGRLVVAEYVRARRPLPPDAERRMRRWCEGWAMPDLDTGEEHVEAARSAGFEDVSLRQASDYTRRSLRRLYLSSLIGIPIDGALRLFGLRNDVQHANTIASLLQYRLLIQGHWFYGILSGRMPGGRA